MKDRICRIIYSFKFGGIYYVWLLFTDLILRKRNASKFFYRKLEKMPPEKYVSALVNIYGLNTGRKLNLDNPCTFNEKIQWLKVYDTTSLKTTLSDKYLVREWVKEKIGEQYLVPLLGVWDKFENINLDELPEAFVLKANHGSGWNVIVKDKKSLDWNEIQKKFNYWLTLNFAFVTGLEMQYAGIKPKIIAEEMLKTENGEDLKDYKVFVFGGKAKIIQVDIERQHSHRRNLYDLDWNYLPYSISHPTAPDVEIPKPECLEELISVSEILGSGFRHVRVDFYICNKKLYFGEMTFTHGSGTEKFDSILFEKEMGSWIDISK